jgi:hypothetical protein
MKNKEDFLYDVRIVNRTIRDGAVSKKEYDKYIESLPDVEDKSEPLIIDDEPEAMSAAHEAGEEAAEDEEE